MGKLKKNNFKNNSSKEKDKTFEAEYVFGGTWSGNKLCGTSRLKCTFTLREIKKFGVKQVIKYYAIKYGIGLKQYNCYISGFGKKRKKEEKNAIDKI